MNDQVTMTTEELLRPYSTRPEQLRLSFGTSAWTSLPGMEARHLPLNPLGLTGTMLLTSLSVPGVGRGKKDRYTKRTQSYALVHRSLMDVARAGEDTPNLLGVLAQIPDCTHSHLVLELNVLAYVLQLPASVALGCYAHTPTGTPELITVQRVPDLIKALLNDAYVVRRNQARTRPDDGTRGQAVPGGQLSRGNEASAVRGGSVPAPAGSRTGGRPAAPGHPADCPAPGRAAPVQQVRRRLQQQELFGL
ncbi:MAG: hypothetical protein NVS3B25_25090 [Hymenobacter sp.]